jgi:glycerophosphoryl diester phosphodiesterase
MPENTIPGFKLAARQGIDWLEMDVVISGDGQVVVSHEPWINAAICLAPNGDTLTAEQGKAINLYQLDYSKINDYDCGSRVHPNFPDQEIKPAAKPLLSKVVEEIEEHIVLYGLYMVGYNIEVKSNPEWYGIYQPQPAEYAQIIVDEIQELNIDERLIIQSFDDQLLEEIRKLDNTLEIALLVDNDAGFEANMDRLSFVPEHYSPHERLVNADLIEKVRSMDMEIHVWTVNDESRMLELIALHVDGIITDYPDRLVKLVYK